MARYHVAGATPAAAANAAFLDIRTAATKRVRLLELGIFATAATATNPLSLERSTTLGTTSTTVVPQAGEPGDPAATAVIGTAWSAAPASTAVPLRRAVIPGNIGAGIIWTFGMNDMVIPVSASLVVMNRGAGAGPISAFYVVYDE